LAASAAFSSPIARYEVQMPISRSCMRNSVADPAGAVSFGGRLRRSA
jgi:hypothetical protein